MFKKISAFAFALFFSILTVTISAQQTTENKSAKAGNKQQESPFEVLLYTSEQEISIGQPLILTLTFRNADQKTHTFSSVLNLAGDFDMKVSRLYKMPERYYGTSKPAMYPNNVFEDIRPFSTKKIVYMVFFEQASNKGLLFDLPTEYFVDVMFKYQVDLKDTYSLQFPRIRITAKQPEGNLAKIQETFKNKDLFMDLQKLMPSDTSREDMKKLVEMFPDEELSQYAKFCLLREKADPDNKIKELPGVINELNEFMKKYPDFPFNDNIVYTIATYYDKLNDEAKVKEMLLYLYSTYPESPMINEKSGLYQDYIFKGQEKKSDMTWMLYE